MIDRISIFWERNPAFFCGFTLFLGSLFALQTFWALIPLVCLLHKKYVLKAMFLFILPLFLVHHFYLFPPSETYVEGIFHITHLKKSERFGQKWIYRGVLKTPKGKVFCQTVMKEHLPATCSYKVHGLLTQRSKYYYSLKTNTEGEAIKSKRCLAEWRYNAKERAKRYIHTHISQKRAAAFLTAMVVGEMEDRVMLKEFKELGLSHIMVISGFHFALITLAFHFFLRTFLPHKLEAALLMGLLTLYLIFIGDTPSIMRAWIVAMVFLLGQLIEKNSSALNSLGVALSISLLLNPLTTTTLSFQLSFLATAGILVFYRHFDQLLQWWIPKRYLHEVIEKKPPWQVSYIARSFFRETCALSLAVHIPLLPFLLYTFHTFTFNSLIYNLFFPLLASFALLLFLIGMLCGSWVHWINGYYCEWILKITESPPFHCKSIEVEALSPLLFTFIMTFLLLVAIALEVKKGSDCFSVADGPLFNHR